MVDQFADARLKIERADKHIADLKSILLDLPNCYIATIDHHTESGGNSIKHELPNAESVRRNIAVITGDAIHSLKSSLDYAWIGAIQKIGGDPAHSKFPIADTVEKLEAMMKGAKIKALSPALYELIMVHIKPYEAGTYYIWALHRLNIADKHHLVLPLVNNISVRGISVEKQSTGEIITGDSMGRMSDGPMRFDFDSTINIKDKGKASISVLFGPGVPLNSQEILETLLTFSRFTLSIVKALESFPVI